MARKTLHIEYLDGKKLLVSHDTGDRWNLDNLDKWSQEMDRRGMNELPGDPPIEWTKFRIVGR